MENNKQPLVESFHPFMKSRVFNIVAAWITGLILATYTFNTSSFDTFIGTYAESLMQQIAISKNNPFMHLTAFSLVITLLFGKAIRYTLIIWDGFMFSFNSSLSSIFFLVSYLHFEGHQEVDSDLVNTVFFVISSSFIVMGLACNAGLQSAMHSPYKFPKILFALFVVSLYPITSFMYSMGIN